MQRKRELSREGNLMMALRWSREKQRPRNVQKNCAARAKLLLLLFFSLIRNIDVFAVLVAVAI